MYLFELHSSYGNPPEVIRHVFAESEFIAWLKYLAWCSVFAHEELCEFLSLDNFIIEVIEVCCSENKDIIEFHYYPPNDVKIIKMTVNEIKLKSGIFLEQVQFLE